MGKVRFDRIARECRKTFRGDFSNMPIVGLEHIEPYDMELKNYEINVETTFTKQFHKGQILFGRRRAYQHKACVATFDGICSGDITVIEPIEGEVYPDLLPFIIQNDDFFEHAIKGSNGALSPRVKWEHMANFEFDLPSLAEQKVLAEKLWAAYEVKQSYLKMIAATEEMVKAQFVEMFKNETMVPLGNFCFIEKGSTITRNEVSPGDIPVVAGGQEPSCYHNASNRESGMITVSASGAYAGYVNYWSCPIFASDCNTICPKDKNKTDSIFLYYGLKAMQTQIYELQKGGAQPHVYGKDLQKLFFPLPSSERQQCFSRIAQQTDKSISELRKSVDAIDKVIKSLINENL